MAEPNAAQQQVETPDLDTKLDRLFNGPDEPQQPEQQAEPEQAEPEQEAAETEQQEADESTPEYVEVEYKGTKYNIPPELKDALAKEAEYTTQSQSVAQQRKEVELQQKALLTQREERQFQESVKPDLDRMALIEQYVNHVKKTTDWNALTSDQLVRTRFEIDQLNDEYAALGRALQGKYTEFKQKVDGEREKNRKEMAEHLAKVIPGFNDTVKSDIEKYVTGLGYPEAALSVMSSLDYQVAWKAAQFDKLKADTKAAVKKASEAPTIKATSRKQAMPPDVRAKLDLRNAKTPEQKAKALDKRLDALFG
jgi:hypothetical protein